MTDVVFRFVNVRPAQQPAEASITQRFARFDLQDKSPLHQTIAALPPNDKRKAANDLAEAMLDAVPAIGTDLTQLFEAFDKAKRTNTLVDAKTAAEEVLGEPLAAYLASQRAKGEYSSLWDLLYAHALLPDKAPGARQGVVQGIRAFHFMRMLHNGLKLAADKADAVTPAIPVDLIPEQDSGKYEPSAMEMELLQRLDATTKTADEIEAARNDLLHVARALGRSGAFKMDAVDKEEVPGGEGGKVTITTVTVPEAKNWVYEDLGRKHLKAETLQTLQTHCAGMGDCMVAELVDAMDNMKIHIASDFVKSIPGPLVRGLLGGGALAKLTKVAGLAFYPPVGLPDVISLHALPLPEPTPTPASRGIRPLGIGDLMVVKQQLLRYEMGEVAHIENVMSKEARERTHSRLREIEETITIESESIEENEKDLQTTERFELQKEAQQTIASQMNAEAGVTVSGTYGTVSVSASAKFAVSQSISKSTREASSFAKQVTDRSVSRIVQRAREERTRRSLERFEETNKHGFDNTQGNHIVGVYRWVDKFYKARLVNYGRRLMLEFIVPEPSAFYRFMEANHRAEVTDIPAPKPPLIYGRPLRPSDLNSVNFLDYVAAYNVHDADAYPLALKVVSQGVADAPGGSGSNNVAIGKVDMTLVVPQGYRCVGIHGIYSFGGYSGRYLNVFVHGKPFQSADCYGATGPIAISITGWAANYAVNIAVTCEVTDEFRQTWQLKTFGSIITAYQLALANYNEQVAAAEIQGGVQIKGRNPEINRKIERDELKKASLRALTDNFAITGVSGVWRYNEAFNAMHAAQQYGYPEFNVNEAQVEGKMIQFFEQAFDWNNMTYRFYPYIWGRKEEWAKVFPLTDNDPIFMDFLRAGAARVVVPAQVGYTEAVLHYMKTNEIWEGDEPPTIDDPLYIAIVDELKSDSQADPDGNLEVCAIDKPYPCLVGEWEVKLPTTLTYLQADAKLP